ncbi:MAG: site-specific integrase [Nitrospirae bacterium]|nr:site-specific integrase [Nitrospirota bacterium]
MERAGRAGVKRIAMRHTSKQHELPLFDYEIAVTVPISAPAPAPIISGSPDSKSSQAPAMANSAPNDATAEDLQKKVTILDVLNQYEAYLSTNCKSINTVHSFCSDMRKLALFMGGKGISKIDIHDLRGFIVHMREQGDQPKTTARRQSSIKNFFRWLYDDGLIPRNPAEQLIFTRAIPPLPDILTGEEAERFDAAARRTPLEYVLTLFLLGAGLKRSEILEISISNVDISDPDRPAARIRTKDPSKDRNVDLPLDFVGPYREYLAQYQPKEKLFAFTDRHLNDILYGIAERAGIKKKVSCQILRDTFATRCVKAGEDIEVVLKKLGLALSTMNEETKIKYRKLAEVTS